MALENFHDYFNNSTAVIFVDREEINLEHSSDINYST